MADSMPRSRHAPITPRLIQGSIALVLLVSPVTGSAFWGSTLVMEPQPFRQEQVLEGRTFNYNDESFIHRNTFTSQGTAFHTAPLPRDHLEGLGGSTRTRELLLDVSVQTTREIDEAGRGDVQYRFRRTEDFDGRYSRNLVGFGLHPGGGFQARLMADLRGDKSRIDFQPELGWQDSTGNAVRLAVVFPDYLFNDKQDQGRYLQQPMTLFGAGELHATESSTLRGYISASPETELEITPRERRYRNESLQGGASILYRLGKSSQLRWLAEGEATNRHETVTTDSRSASMKRRAWRSRVTLTFDGDYFRQWRLGSEFLSLSERGDRIGNAQQLSNRDEHLVFAGVEKTISPDWRFAPELFVTHVDGASFSDADPQRTEHDGTYAKTSLPFTWAPSGSEGPQITLNPTLELHTVAFGGGNVRVRIPL